MRIRPLVVTLMLGSTSALILAGCSGKPENSPVIRKKFAEMEKMQENVETLVAETQILKEEVRTLNEQNKELRAFLPDVDGAPALEKISALESRLNKLEGMAADRLVADASTSGSSTGSSSSSSASNNSTTTASAGGSSNSSSMETDQLAGSSSSSDSQDVVAAQQQSSQATAPEKKTAQSGSSQSFKEKTNKSASSSSSSSNSQQASSSSSSKRGSYYAIESGDTIESIAQKHGTNAEAIRKANRIPNGARIARGQKLYIPAN